MSGAVILHPDEHLESHDPFQHRHTDNQPLASVTAVHSPHPGLITGICGKKDIISSGSGEVGEGCCPRHPSCPQLTRQSRAGKSKQQRQELPRRVPRSMPAALGVCWALLALGGGVQSSTSIFTRAYVARSAVSGRPSCQQTMISTGFTGKKTSCVIC